MESPRLLSEIETHLFEQVCDAMNLKSEDQRKVLMSFVLDESTPEWARLVSLMESNGPLSIMTEDEFKYLSSHDATRPRDPSSQIHEDPSLFSQILPPLVNQKSADFAVMKDAIHDVLQYNDALENKLTKYKEYAGRGITNLRRPPETNSRTAEKIAALALQKDRLKREIRELEDRLPGDRLEDLATIEPNAENADYDSYRRIIKSTVMEEVVKTSFAPFDHVLGKLNALHAELSHEAFEDDATPDIARRYARQAVLSMARKCRASLDMVFLEASVDYSTRASPVSDHTGAIDDERNAVYAEIQSLWDEMVPLAHMVVEKEHLKLISKKTSMFSERQKLGFDMASTYITETIGVMNERLSVLADRVKMLAYHHQALLNAFAYGSRGADSQPTWTLASTGINTNQDKANGKAKGFTLLETIKRQMEVYGAIPIDVGKQLESEQPQSRSTLGIKLDRYVTARQKKGDVLARHVHDSFETAVQAELTDAELGGQLLLDSVLSGSAAGQMGNLVYEDLQVEESVSALNLYVEQIRATVKNVQDSHAVPSSAADVVAQASNNATKPRQRSQKGGEGSQSVDYQERCPKFADLIRRWDDPARHTN
ncbi:hypothetical protein GGR54DRAFT_330929 [Hypoxylon sp. NC1633]|nr:hypothetical protein GGR54DRAFT_330929 [Hypoxylon sp. NC1633]